MKGIGIVTCLYWNPEKQRAYVLDFRIFAPEVDGKTKLDHVKEILLHLVNARKIPFKTVLMDSWYATTDMMMTIGKDLGKIYYCPLKSNRLVKDRGADGEHVPVDSLDWSEEQREKGRVIHIHKFPKNEYTKLFRFAVSTDRTDYVVTNDLSQDSSSDAQKESAIRWKIEEFHRELKQLTGIEKCQARLERSQRNHICLSILAWICLKEAAIRRGVTAYMQKREPLMQFMAEQWRNPATAFC